MQIVKRVVALILLVAVTLLLSQCTLAMSDNGTTGTFSPELITASNAIQSGTPWAAESLLTGIRVAKEKGVSQSVVIEAVKVRGVDFALTAETERTFRQAGATDELIRTIRENCRGSKCNTTSSPAPRNGGAGEFSSEYTSFKTDCRAPKGAMDNGDGIPKTCKGYGNYQVTLTPSCCEVQISVESRNGNTHIVLASQKDNFGTKGEKLEWRMFNGKPFAVILRIEKFKKDRTPPYQEADKIGTALLVKGLKGYEKINFEVDPKTTPNPNEEARRLADTAYPK